MAMFMGVRTDTASGPILRPILVVARPAAVAKAKASKVAISPIHSSPKPSRSAFTATSRFSAAGRSCHRGVTTLSCIDYTSLRLSAGRGGHKI